MHAPTAAPAEAYDPDADRAGPDAPGLTSAISRRDPHFASRETVSGRLFGKLALA